MNTVVYVINRNVRGCTITFYEESVTVCRGKAAIVNADGTCSLDGNAVNLTFDPGTTPSRDASGPPVIANDDTGSTLNEPPSVTVRLPVPCLPTTMSRGVLKKMALGPVTFTVPLAFGLFPITA